MAASARSITFNRGSKVLSQLTEWLWRACSTSRLHAELAFRLTLPSGRELIAVARIADLGAPNGMLLFRTYDEVRDSVQALLDMGYGYSVVDEPRPDEEFDLESFQEMFRDWGWSGKLGGKPTWMR
jgi:hypothetical protein